MANTEQTVGGLPILDTITNDDELIVRRAADGSEYRITRQKLQNLPLPIANGGTGSTTINAIRTKLGLGSASRLNIPVPIVAGGTGAKSLAGAQANLGIGASTTGTGLPAFSGYAGLRNYTRSSQNFVLIYGTGFSGLFWADTSDTTSSDNGGTIIVATDNTRWKRIYNGLVNVRWFGATGDGTTNDAPAFNAAISAYRAQVIYAPAGSYYLATSVSFSYASLVGDGPDTVFINGTTNQPALIFGATGSRVYSRRVENFSVTQASTVTAVSGNQGILFQDCGQFHVNSVFAHALNGGSLYEGFYFTNCSQFELWNVRAQSCLNDNIRFDNNCLDVYWSGGRSDACVNGSGIDIRNCQGFYIVNVSCYGNGKYAWHLADGGTAVNRNMWFTNCIGDTSATYNWAIGSLSYGFFSGCWGSTQKSTTTNTSATGFYVVGTSGTGVVNLITFSGGVATNNNAHGMYLDSVDSISIQGFIATDNAKATTGSGFFLATSNVTNINIIGGDAKGNSSPITSYSNSTTIQNVLGYAQSNLSNQVSTNTKNISNNASRITTLENYITQGGYVSGANAGANTMNSISITLPRNFSNSGYSVVVSPVGFPYGASAQVTCGAANTTSTGFDLQWFTTSTNTANQGFSWIATGY